MDLCDNLNDAGRMPGLHVSPLYSQSVPEYRLETISQFDCCGNARSHGEGSPSYGRALGKTGEVAFTDFDVLTGSQYVGRRVGGLPVSRLEEDKSLDVDVVEIVGIPGIRQRLPVDQL
ncbi:hypothetical protein N7456_012041 [Penicillium angulare]|uniref:Uncharacterized protein n=1 Tax=Penicillium angulare TaxID=116970 RepID=A0A9W9K0N2_9EURO|nr:hypothetical protein N7456_012041 [Penicillium angulare]